MKKPDFAFPKTTAETAEKDLNQAINQHDAHTALNALIRYYISQSLIDRESIPTTIGKIEEVSETFSDDKLHAMFIAFEAYVYKQYYSENQWKYDNRQTPLEPYPANISEWSGQQFCTRINKLCMESITGNNAKKLSECDIKHYSDLIKYDTTSSIYFPTLLDFAYINAYDLVYDTDNTDNKDQIIELAINNSTKGSAQNIYWQTTQIEKLHNSGKNNKPKAIRQLFDENANNQYAGYILYTCNIYPEYIFILDDYEDENTENKDSDLAYRTWLYNSINSYLSEFKDTPFKESLKTKAGQLAEPSVKCTTKQYYTYNKPIEISVNNENAKNYTIEIYKLKEHEIDLLKKSNFNIRSKRAADYEFKIHEDREYPFKADTTLFATLQDAGCYAIIPVVPGATSTDYTSYIQVVPVMPVGISNITTPMVATLDAATGAPLDGVKVTLKNNNKNQTDVSAISDQQGIAKINLSDRTYYNKTILSYKNNSYDFGQLGLSRYAFEPSTEYNYSANILTDRAIYHPGETVQTMAVLFKSLAKDALKLEKDLCANAKVTLTLYDVNNQQIDKFEGITDDYGRITAEFKIPEDGLTGWFSIRATIEAAQWSIASTRLMVSDFKMPDFEITDTYIERNVPNTGDVTICGTTRSYSGMPLEGTNVELTINAREWGWWISNTTTLTQIKALTNDKGEFRAVVPDSLLKANDKYLFFTADMRAESASGTFATSSIAFATGKQYYISIETSGNKNIDGQKPFCPQVKIYAPNDSIVNFPLKYAIKKDKEIIQEGEFTGKIDISNITPGDYKLTVSTVDESLAESSDISITIYNTSTDIVPGNDLIWTYSCQYNTSTNKVEILYGTTQPDVWVHMAISTPDGKLIDIVNEKEKQGYHFKQIDIPAEYQQIYLHLFTIRDCKQYESKIQIYRDKEDHSLKITGESFRDKLVPGDNETWKIRVEQSNKGVQSALVLDMYNKALDALQPHSLYMRFPVNAFNCQLNLRTIYNRSLTTSASKQYKGEYSSFLIPKFYFYGVNSIFDNGIVMYKASSARESRMVLYDANANCVLDECEYEMPQASMTDDSAMAFGDIAEYETSDMTSGSNQPQEIEYRGGYTPLAVWAPRLTTDSEGKISYTFTVPNANTTWRLNAVAWTKEMECGSLVQDFVASKPIMVQPNLPRFMRAGDKASIVALVMNNSDEATEVKTIIEIFNPVTSAIISTQSYTSHIEPKSTATVAITVDAKADAEAIGYRIRSTANGFTDGEQNVIRILPSESALIETTPFYLNQGETEYTMTLPKEKGARLSLTFCENPSWTIVSALPGLRTQIDDYANSAAAALYSAAIAKGIVKDNPAIGNAIEKWSSNPSDSALISMLEKNEDLKIAVLNATPWVQAAQSDTERMANLALILNDNEVNRSITKSLDILIKLQQNDGGWMWGKWCDNSSEWVTSNVLSMIADLKTLGWLPDDNRLHSMVVKALRYYDQCMNQVENNKGTDLIYAIVRPQFNDVTISDNGKKVINRTIDEIRSNWEKYSSVSYKATAAQALWLNNDKALAKTLMQSVSEFGVMTPNQGLRFPSVNALYEYALILQAYAMITPDSKDVDGLRQQLIVRKQGTDWGNAVVTTEVVQAILSSGSNWLVDAKGAKIMVGKKEIEPSSEIETATGSLRADLSKYNGQKLTVATTGTGPSYGAVYAQFSKLMADVKAHACDDLDIEKQMFVQDGINWVTPEELKVGDRVKVQLTIHCKRNLQYVSIVDQRPACFEPAIQIPRWLWSEGVGFYLENRDSQTQLHVIYMQPGTYLLTYEMNVGVGGTFSSGVATIQSQYAPEISAHSSGTLINVKEK